MKNYRLSDDIAFRFGNRGWEEWPLSAEKFAHASWASHVDLETGRPVEREDARWSEQARRVSPSPPGAHRARTRPRSEAEW